MIARFVNAAPGTTTLPIRHATIGNPPPAYPARRPRAARRPVDQRGQPSTTGGVQRDVRVCARAEWALADCRTVPFPGHRIPAQLCVKGGFDPTRLYQRVLTPSAMPLVTRDRPWPPRGTSRRSSAAPPPTRRARRTRWAGADPPRRRDRRLAVGRNHPDVHPSRLQRRRRRASMEQALPRIAARQTPINLRFGVPGGAASLFEAGSEPGDLVGRLQDRARGRRRASLSIAAPPRTPVPRSSRRSGGWNLGTAACRRTWSAPTRGPTSPCPPTSAAITIPARHTRRARRFRPRRSAAAARLRAAGQPEPRGRPDTGADARARRLGRPRRGAAGEPLSAPGARRVGAARDACGRVRRHPRRPRSGAAAEPGARGTTSVRAWC